jgi:hypothetical protein
LRTVSAGEPLVSAKEALDKNARCYAPGPHTAFNGANWCCR